MFLEGQPDSILRTRGFELWKETTEWLFQNWKWMGVSGSPPLVDLSGITTVDLAANLEKLWKAQEGKTSV